MKKEMPVRKEFSYSPIRSWRNGNPFVIAFVYTRKDEAFIVKGGLTDVELWLENFSKNTPCFVHLGFWKDKSCRHTQFKIFGLALRYSSYCFQGWPRENKSYYDDQFNLKVVKNVRNIYRHRLVIYDKNGDGRTALFEKSFRRLPRKWLKEFDKFIA